MTARILALNAGSSSLKAALPRTGGRRLITVERLGTPGAQLLETGVEQPVAIPGCDVGQALAAVLAMIDPRDPPITAVAHRVVHGGLRHEGPALLDDALLAELDGLVQLAPLHMPAGLAVLRAARRALAGVPHTVSFDTALWRALPDESQRLPVPDEVHLLGVQRYGFHGLSVQHVRNALQSAGHGHGGRLVVAHLGAGCSVSALRDGRPVHTSMSFTPTAGLVSATRSGDLDPHVVLHLLDQPDWDAERVRDALDRHSGLAGPGRDVSDVRDLLDRRDSEPAADLAVRIFTRSIAMTVAACAALLDGIDTLVFTGGVGEHAGPVRQQVADRLTHLGVCLDVSASSGDISAPCSPVRSLIIPADEEAVLEREASELLGAAGS